MLALVDLQKVFKTGHSYRMWLILIIGTLSLGILFSCGICVKSTSLYHTQFEFFLNRHLKSFWILFDVCMINLVLLMLLLLFLQKVYHLLILLRSILRISAISSECLPKWSQSILLLIILLSLTDILHWKTATKISYSERLQFYSWVLARIINFPVSLLEYILVIVFTIVLLDYSFGVLSCKKWLTYLIWI